MSDYVNEYRELLPQTPQEFTVLAYERYQDYMTRNPPVVGDSPIRAFEGGATRDSETGKLDFEGFLSPQVLWEFAVYMDKHRHMPDGTVRGSDNWQAVPGIPANVYMKSLLRHVFDLWLMHRGGTVVRPESGETPTEADTLGGIMFNLQGYWLQAIRESE